MTFDGRPVYEAEEVEDAPRVLRPPMIRTARGITIILNGESFSVARTHPNYELVKEAIQERRWDDLPDLVNVEEAVATYCQQGNIVVRDGIVLYKDPRTGIEEECSGFVVDRILQFMEEGEDAEALLNFLDKIMTNTSSRVIRDLYTFLSNRNMPLDVDGDFYGYKAVKNDWMDKHSGTISNKPGEIIVFNRRNVDDDPQHDCSHGLHVGSIQYVKQFANRHGEERGDKIVIVKVNPADVVAVPEYDTTKLRCCRYEVIEEYRGILPDTTYEAGGLTEAERRPMDEDTDETFEDEDGEICDDCGNLIEDCDCDFDDIGY